MAGGAEVKGPCDTCGSSDANHEYDDHYYCFSCETRRSKDGSDTVHTDVSSRPGGRADLGECTDLPKRRLTQQTCEKYGYKVGGGNHVMTYRNDSGKTLTKFRNRDKEFWWEGRKGNPQLYGQWLFPKGGKQLVITEGELDALSVYQSLGNWPVVSLPDGASSGKKHILNNLEYVESFDKVILCFDNDTAGSDAIEAIAPLLTPGKCHVVNWPEGIKDASDMLQQERQSEVRQYVTWDATEYRPDGIIPGDTLEKDLLDVFHGIGDATGYDIDNRPILNRKLRGLRKGEITLWTAGTGCGKSTEVHEISYGMLMDHGLRIGVIALEESVKTAALRYLSIKTNRKLQFEEDRQGLSEEDYKDAYARTVGSGRMFFYDHFGSVDSDNLLSRIRFLAQGCTCDFIILDHVSIAVSGIDTDDRKALDILMTQLRTLVEHTGVGLLLIAHLRKSQGRDDIGFEDGAAITLDSLRGSGTLKQIPDSIIALEHAGDSKTKVKILKNRMAGTIGYADTLLYNDKTGRLMATNGEDEAVFDNETITEEF
jgi:twinkle protein